MTITFNLITGRTEDDIFKDVALINNYSSTIENIETFIQEGLNPSELASFIYPNNVIEESKKIFTQGNSIVNIEYQTSTQISNPITDVVFGKDIFTKEFEEKDAKIIRDSALLKARIDYNLV